MEKKLPDRANYSVYIVSHVKAEKNNNVHTDVPETEIMRIKVSYMALCFLFLKHSPSRKL